MIKLTRFKDFPRVQFKELSSVHLISFHPERDILPIFLANCQYTFEVGKGLQTEYNYSAIENTLVDKFLYSKYVILVEPVEEVSDNQLIFANVRSTIVHFY